MEINRLKKWLYLDLMEDGAPGITMTLRLIIEQHPDELFNIVDEISKLAENDLFTKGFKEMEVEDWVAEKLNSSRRN